MTAIASRWSGHRVASVRSPFALLFLAYAGLASALVFAFGFGANDSLARVANAAYVLVSRDPHLAAVGFVWGPVPSLVMLPLVPFSAAFPDLLRLGFAANLMSAACMAGAVIQLFRLLGDLGTPRGARAGITILFGLHPMVLYHGVNGMTEAPFFLFLLLACRALVAWTATSAIGRLTLTGSWLGLAYLTRYEALAAGLAVMAFVGATTGLRQRRRAPAVTDMVLVGIPFLFAVGLWALMSWVVVGSPAEQFTSSYGNASQMATTTGGVSTAATLGGAGPAAGFVARQLWSLAPFAVMSLVAMAVLACRRRTTAPLAVLAVLGGALAFSIVAFVLGLTSGWYRYQLVVVPLAAVGFGALAAIPRRAGSGRAAATALAVAAALLTLPITATSMLAPDLAVAERDDLAPVLDRFGVHLTETGGRSMLGERLIADHLDAMDLGPGTVLVDTFLGFPIVLASRHPSQFVITSDRDFEQVLADPALFGVRYVLTVAPDHLGAVDAVNRQHPGIYASGAGIGTAFRDFPAGKGGFRWRLYEVRPVEPPDPQSG